MKRLSCTVGDKRGFKMDAMHPDPNGRYVEYSSAVNFANNQLIFERKRAGKAINEANHLRGELRLVTKERDLLLQGELRKLIADRFNKEFESVTDQFLINALSGALKQNKEEL